MRFRVWFAKQSTPSEKGAMYNRVYEDIENVKAWDTNGSWLMFWKSMRAGPGMPDWIFPAMNVTHVEKLGDE